MQRSSSFEFGVYALEYFREHVTPGGAPLVINSFRIEELSPEMRGVTFKSIESGHHGVDLDLLSPSQVHQMLHGMAPGRFDTISGELAQITGGNPLHVVECAKECIESGSLESAERCSPTGMPLSGRVALVVTQRLERLSPEARRLANAIAITQQDFSIEFAAALLEVPMDLLVEPWKELEQSHIIKGSWFSHDLVGQAILGTTPTEIRDALQRKVKALRASLPESPFIPVRGTLATVGDGE